MKVQIKDLIDIYNQEVSVHTKNKNKVYNFEKYKISYIFKIKDMLENGTYQMARYNIFSIFEPKLRIIMSLDISSRIVDHYISKYILIPKINKYLDIRNVASRKDMGMHYGIKLLKKYIECNKKYDNVYALKLDISKFFYTIDHQVLKDMLANILSPDELELISKFIDSTDKEYVNKRISQIKENLLLRATTMKQRQEILDIPYYEKGKGITIGNVSSQLLSIFYLSSFDFYVIHTLKCKYMIRYCDDIIIFHHDREYLKKVYDCVIMELKKYKLNINSKKCFIINIKHGFIFCGHYIRLKGKKTIVKICNKTRNKVRKNLVLMEKLYNKKIISFNKYFCSLNSYYSMLDYRNK